MFGCILLTLSDYFENVNRLKSGNVTSHVLWGVPMCDTCFPYLLESKGHAPEMRDIQRKGVKKKKKKRGRALSVVPKDPHFAILAMQLQAMGRWHGRVSVMSSNPAPD